MKFSRFLLLSSCLVATAVSSEETSESLRQARELEAPVPTRTVQGEMEAVEFWEEHSNLLRAAWHDWEDPAWKFNGTSLTELFDSTLRTAVDRAWKDPDQYEEDVRQLWKPIAPDVFAAQLLDPSQLHQIRHFINLSKTSGIPIRRPNGMNRHGIIIDPDTDGAVHMTTLTDFGQLLSDRFVRPIGRLLFPEFMSWKNQDDVESYGFTIQYQPDKDRVLREHTDASLITLNINLNLPGDEETVSYGSNPHLHFSGKAEGQTNFTFAPGMAVIHRGMKRHAAYTIQSGERVQWIVWLFGRDGFVRVTPYPQDQQLSPKQRWSNIATSPRKQEEEEENATPFELY